MNKRKTSKVRGAFCDDIEEIDKDLSHLDAKIVDPRDFFKDHTQVGGALLQCLLENDTEAFIEILHQYLHVNKSRVAKNADLSRSTVQLIFSKKGNPTLKTLAKIVHHEAGYSENIRNKL